jgi:hypothetical protein
MPETFASIRAPYQSLDTTSVLEKPSPILLGISQSAQSWRFPHTAACLLQLYLPRCSTGHLSPLSLDAALAVKAVQGPKSGLSLWRVVPSLWTATWRILEGCNV